MDFNNFSNNNILKDHCLRLLVLIDYSNHAIKQGKWYPDDVKEFYALKDMVMEKLYRDPPKEAKINLKKVAYSNKYNNCEPCSYEADIQENILIEMEVLYAGRIFCYHIPLEKSEKWGVDINALEDKDWISSCEHNRMTFKGIFDEIRQLSNCTDTFEKKDGLVFR